MIGNSRRTPRQEPLVRASCGTFLLALLLALGGCATAPGQPARPSTLSDLLLALDASEKMGGDPRCRTRSVATTEVLIPVELAGQGVSGRWTERWTVDRCGSRVPYVVKFARALDGDLDVSMQREEPAGAEAMVPGTTLADRVLQRDTFAYLALRDLGEAGPEAACRTRKVVATAVVEPLQGAEVEAGRPVAGQWVERWTLDRCGTPASYRVRFHTNREGTTMSAEPQR